MIFVEEECTIRIHEAIHAGLPLGAPLMVLLLVMEHATVIGICPTELQHMVIVLSFILIGENFICIRKCGEFFSCIRVVLILVGVSNFSELAI